MLKKAWILIIMALVLVPASELQAEDGDCYTIYDNDWNMQGYIKRNDLIRGKWDLYDRNWNRAGCVKWNAFSDRYDIFDQDWNRKGYLEGNRPSLEERR